MSGIVLLILRVILALGLYTFLFWALLTMWKELAHHGEFIASRRALPISIQVQNEGRLIQTLHFTKPELVIGRDQACDCPLNDEAVSGNHASLSHHHGHWWVEDLRSTNGTYLNGAPVTIPTIIVTNDVITCGQSQLIISLSESYVWPDDNINGISRRTNG